MQRRTLGQVPSVLRGELKLLLFYSYPLFSPNNEGPFRKDGPLLRLKR